ncbi:hypothetical protein ACPUER_35955 [Burkholderia sp. DN3021]|uniref:hypothetical protein n=1 Tax=Burkholderia sp. DN3021 TaxID=3410137 RepID=UPI003C7E1B0E
MTNEGDLVAERCHPCEPPKNRATEEHLMRSRTARSPRHLHASDAAKALTKGFEHSTQIFKNVYKNITKYIQFGAMHQIDA